MYADRKCGLTTVIIQSSPHAEQLHAASFGGAGMGSPGSRQNRLRHLNGFGKGEDPDGD